MSITSRINEMSSHIEQAYDELQGLGADLTNINKNIENISMVLDDIYDSMPQVSGEGTSLTLDDTRVGKIKSTLKGNTSQTTYSGKNKLDLTGITARTISAGITITPNFNGDLLQNIKISGTPTTTAWQTIKRITLPAGSYIMTGINISQTTKTGLRIGVYIDSARQYFINAYSTSYSFTLEEETSMDYVVWVQSVDYYPTGDIYVTPMIRLSSVSDDTYEPYTNGASPNPDYPQKIETVSGDNIIKIEGKNLFYDYTDDYTTRGITITKGENELTLNGTYDKLYNGDFWLTKSINSTSYNDNIILLKANTTYTFKLYFVEGTMTGTPNCVLSSRTASDKTFAWNYRTIAKGTNGYQDTWTPTEDIYLAAIRFPVQPAMTVVCNNLKIRIQVEKSSAPTSYEPYQGNTYPINLGVKNLWNSEDMKSGYLPQSGSYPTTDPSYPNSRYIIVPLMKGQSITTYSEVTYSAFRIRYIDKDTNLIVGTVSVGENNGYCNSNATYQSGFANGTITATKDVLLGLWDFDGYMSTSGYYKITYGTTLQQISPNPIELCKIGDYQDYIYKDNGSWYLHKEIGKVVLDGSERGWGRSGSSSNDVFVGALNLNHYGIGIYSKQSTASSWLVNRFSYGTLGALNKFNVYNPDATYGYNNIGFGISTDIVNDIDTFKTWVLNNNIVFYYLLATPTNTEITYQPLIDQLNLLEKAQSKENQTNISQVNNDLPFIISASALKEWAQ